MTTQITAINLIKKMTSLPVTMNKTLDKDYKMILHDKKIIFVHAPRTSGTSIENEILSDQLVPDTQKHLRASQIRSTIKEQWNDYFKFTIVRNPWDRVISMYHQVFHQAYGIRGNKPLEFFLQYYRPAPWEHGIQCSDYADEEMDLIIKFEDREHGLKKLEEATGLKINSSRKSRSREREKKDYREYYNDFTKNSVAKYFAKDIKLYNYSF